METPRVEPATWIMCSARIAHSAKCVYREVAVADEARASNCCRAVRYDSLGLNKSYLIPARLSTILLLARVDGVHFCLSLTSSLTHLVGQGAIGSKGWGHSRQQPLPISVRQVCCCASPKLCPCVKSTACTIPQSPSLL